VPTIEDARTWRGYDVVGPDAKKLGTVEDIYLDQETGEPEWVTLKTGMFGGKLSFAPLTQARQDGDTIVLLCEKDQIKDAPRVDADGALSQDEEAQLYRHYGLENRETPPTPAWPTATRAMT
jgi:sporulation protein YlmC with PRC-barrel domain